MLPSTRNSVSRALRTAAASDSRAIFTSSTLRGISCIMLISRVLASETSFSNSGINEKYAAHVSTRKNRLWSTINFGRTLRFAKNLVILYFLWLDKNHCSACVSVTAVVETMEGRKAATLTQDGCYLSEIV